MLTIGVLGANGFIGSRVVEMFHLPGEYEVVPIAHTMSGLARIARFALDWRIADATDAHELTAAFRGCDIVVHTIGGALESIIKSPRATLKAARAARVRRLIYLSTASVHGQDPQPGTCEDSPLHTRHPVPYNNAKVIAERIFLAQHRSNGVELIVLRPGIVFGPRDAWVSSIASAVIDRTAYLVDGGHGYCNTIYVDNLIHSIRCSIDADASGQVFLVGDAEVVTWRDMYRRIATALGCSSEIPSIPAPTSFSSDQSTLEAVKALPGMQALIDHLPKRVKTFGRRQFETAGEMRHCVRSLISRKEPNPWAHRTQPAPPVSLETALLHRCRHRFDHAKARDALGYVPPISFDEGLRRSIGWLEFIGYSTE